MSGAALFVEEEHDGDGIFNSRSVRILSFGSKRKNGFVVTQKYHCHDYPTRWGSGGMRKRDMISFVMIMPISCYKRNNNLLREAPRALPCLFSKECNDKESACR
jgi:hypothetical protein